METILGGLNKAQREAVTAPGQGRLQIIAGPGTGKTKVLVSRVAYLLIQEKIDPQCIIVTTFTKKAAAEMIQRLSEILKDSPVDLSKLIIGTFHSICFRIIMAYGKLIGVTNNYKIADERDSNQILQETFHRETFIGKDAEMYKTSNSQFDVRAIKRKLSSLKAKGVTPDTYAQDEPKKWNRFIRKVYTCYQERLSDNKLLDFDDCLLTCFELISKHPVMSFIKHVLVDEFQDTNEIQLQLMYQLAQNNVTVVGDPDQSIYAFRDAQATNFQSMRQYYPSINIISLTENYRSTSDILNISERIMSQQRDGRVSKLLNSQMRQSFAPVYHLLPSQEQEARWISYQVELLMNLPNHPFKPNDIAILFRSGYQTRIVENELVRRNISYTMVRGKAFWDRKEVLSILYYLRVVASEHDRIAYLKTINFPKRGLGLKTVDEIEELLSANKDYSIHEVLKMISESRIQSKLSTKNKSELGKYLDIVETCRVLQSNEGDSQNTMMSLFTKLYELSGLKNEFKEVEGADSNILEVQRQLCEFVPIDDKLPVYPEEGVTDEDTRNLLERFIQSIGLYEADNEDSKSKKETSISLSTIHGSKGLEWPIVFVPGLSEGILPAKFALDSGGEDSVNEERRCFYVATTRAKLLLYISAFTEDRERWGRQPISEESRFIRPVCSKLPSSQIAIESFESMKELYEIRNGNIPIELKKSLQTFKQGMELKLKAHLMGESISIGEEDYYSTKPSAPGFNSAKNQINMNDSKRRQINNIDVVKKRKEVKGIDTYFKRTKNDISIKKIVAPVKVSSMSSTTNKAPAYIPIRKVPASYSRIKRLHAPGNKETTSPK
ncbi:hypothetical protein CAAN1_15S01178 [[Candida] anglica]|uniref:DNA 3'-5' helicase n=1 Tax=[Candida] anglica TaxID=148631 RepID=A0ABP0E7X5_9ASCO